MPVAYTDWNLEDASNKSNSMIRGLFAVAYE